MKPTCNEIAEWLADYDDPGMDPTERQAVEAHLSGCHSCRDALEAQRALLGSLKRELSELQPGTPRFQVPQQTLAKASRPASQQASPTPEPGWLERLFASWTAASWAPAAALVLLAALGAVFLFHRSGNGGSGALHRDLRLTLASGRLETVADGTPVNPTAGLAPTRTYRCLDAVELACTGGRIRLGANAVFSEEGNRFALQTGSARFEIEPDGSTLKVVTQAATVGVIGTTFEVIASGVVTLVQVIKGSVRVTSRDETRILAAPDARRFFTQGLSQVWMTNRAGATASATANASAPVSVSPVTGMVPPLASAPSVTASAADGLTASATSSVVSSGTPALTASATPSVISSATPRLTTTATSSATGGHAPEFVASAPASIASPAVPLADSLRPTASPSVDGGEPDPAEPSTPSPEDVLLGN